MSERTASGLQEMKSTKSSDDVKLQVCSTFYIRQTNKNPNEFDISTLQPVL